METRTSEFSDLSHSFCELFCLKQIGNVWYFDFLSVFSATLCNKFIQELGLFPLFAAGEEHRN